MSTFVVQDPSSIHRSHLSGLPDFQDSSFRTNAWRHGVPASADELEPMHPTLLHAFASAAKLEDSRGITLLGERPSDPESHCSFRALYHQSRSIAAALLKLGVGPGDRVIIVLPTCHEFVTSFFAVQLLGAIPVPVAPPSRMRFDAGLSRLAHNVSHSGAEVIVTSTQIRRFIGDLAVRTPTLRHIVTALELSEHAPLDRDFRARPEDAALIQYTSGSTGAPKGVLLAQKNVVANIHAIGQAVQLSSTDRVVSWCPLYHDMGLIGTLLFSIYWRVPVILLSPTSFLARPSRWLWAIHQHGGTLSPSPNFGYALCTSRIKDAEREGLDLSSWRVALSGAEPVNLQTCREFASRFQENGFRSQAVLPVYGLAESVLALTFPTVQAQMIHECVDRRALGDGTALPATDEGSMTVVGVGKAIPGHQILVVDDDGNELPERSVGHIVAAGGSVMQGYFRDEAASAAAIRNERLWTGDLGYFADGHLFVTGRAKDIIIINGRNYYAEDIELAVEGVGGVRRGNCVAFGIYDHKLSRERVVVVCETKLAHPRERKDLVERINDAIVAASELTVDEVVLVEAGTVPKTSSGKRQRSLCRELYLKDELQPARAGKLRMGFVYARSTAGFAVMKAKQLLA